MKGHKAVYQFLSIPYETEGYGQDAKTSDLPSQVGSSENTFAPDNAITSDCNYRLADHRNKTADNHCQKTTVVETAENKGESTVDEPEKNANCLSGSHEYRSIAERSSEDSMSNDSSTNLDELQADLLTTNVLDHMTENMDFVFDNNIPNDNSEMTENEHAFDWLKM